MISGSRSGGPAVRLWFRSVAWLVSALQPPSSREWGMLGLEKLFSRHSSEPARCEDKVVRKGTLSPEAEDAKRAFRAHREANPATVKPKPSPSIQDRMQSGSV